MPGDVDKSILDRLQALRGSSAAAPDQTAAQYVATFLALLHPRNKHTLTTVQSVNVDLIERKGTPSREDALAARLKSLRGQDDEASSPSPINKPASPLARPPRSSPEATRTRTGPEEQPHAEEDDVDDSMFQTDDQTLQELLGDVGAGDTFFTNTEPDDESVRALLEEIGDSIPREGETGATGREDDGGSDSSDGEHMRREVDSVIARFRDELQVEAAALDGAAADESRTPPGPDQDEPPEEDDDDDHHPPPDLTLPSVPADDDEAPAAAASPSSMHDITARLSALRASSSSPSSPALNLPSVPTSRPAAAADEPPRRLETRTGYTDDDVGSWCTVCLEDATLLCLGCASDSDPGGDPGGDPYCVRCWREMHVGPAAAFVDRTHKAVQLTRSRKRDKEPKVALGA